MGRRAHEKRRLLNWQAPLFVLFYVLKESRSPLGGRREAARCKEWASWLSPVRVLYRLG